jgi:hypothetical protein
VRWIDDLTGVLAAAMAAAQRREPLVVVTAPGAADLVQLPAEVAPWTVRVDLSLWTADLSPGLLCHVQGRGIDGVRWALRTIHRRSRRKAHIVRYGAHTDQFGAVRLADRTDGPQPVTVVLHGGFLAFALAARSDGRAAGRPGAAASPKTTSSSWTIWRRSPVTMPADACEDAEIRLGITRRMILVFV